jgi:hypothetical protein
MNGLQVAATGTEPYILLKELLGIDDYRGGTGFNLLLNAPFLACIKPKGPFDGRIYTLQVQFHESFNDELKLNAHLENKTSGSSIKQVFGPFIISSPHSHREYPWLREWTSQIELANIEDGDSLRINLVHTNPNPLVLDEFSDTGISLLTLRKQIQIQTNPYVDIKNPLMAALYRCVPKEELANYFSYKDTKHPQEHAQGIFEQKISKILTGSGFSVMRLGNTKSEKLKDKDDPSIVRSSIDLIAYSESKKHLLVVGCTLASPGERDVGDIAEARLTLLEEVFKDSRIELTPVIFTEAKTIENKIVRGVKLIDAKDIQYLINKLSQNEATEDISSFIISIPSPPPAYEL